jgi:hypothetical protein
MKSYYIHQQSLFKLQLNKKYYLELVGLNFLNLKDSEGNPLTLYESDYEKFRAYLKDHSIDYFTVLTTAEKLFHLEKANVRITRYFSADNLQKFELDVKSSMDSNFSNIVSKNGSMLLKNGEQNCVVVYEGHIYIHPKVRCSLGSINHEMNTCQESKSTTKKGVIGVSHSSLCHGRQVSFAGSIVRDKNNTWTLDTTSGHYITRAYQIKALLNALRDYGMDLSKFIVKLWIPNNPKIIPPILSESDYHIITENAAEYLSRMQDSQSRYIR